jgi:methylmalonyl-CoA/ethylmalonyl-CoA epimerase
VNVTRLHHVAYVVHDLDAALPVFTGRYGLPVTIRELMPEQGVEAVMLGAGEGAVELIAPTDPESGVARYLEKRGEGLHHIALEVDDLPAALEQLRAEGAELIDQEPRVGLGGHLIAFVHPKSGFGALMELVQAGH